MSRSPVVADARATDDEVVALLRKYRMRSIPRVADGRFVGISSLDDYGLPLVGSPVAVIMVGGQGERLRPLTDTVPKPLLKIGGVSIVERLIIAATKAGVRDVYLTLNYKADMFEERLGKGDHLGVALHYVREEEPMGTAGALSLLPDDVTGPLLVMNGDLVTTTDFRSLLDFHWHHQGVITVAGVEHHSPIPYGVLQAVDHRLVGIEEKPNRRELITAGIYAVDGEGVALRSSGRARAACRTSSTARSRGLAGERVPDPRALVRHRQPGRVRSRARVFRPR